MATRYRKDKYACVKNLKNEPLSLITPGPKKRKQDEGKDESPILTSLFGTPSSPTYSLELMTFSPPTTRSKGNAKIGKNIWDDPATAFGRAHNVIIDDELRCNIACVQLQGIIQDLYEESSIELEVLVDIHSKAKVHGKCIIEVKLSFGKKFS
ncbi:hypothetical protein SO802_026360 [Lithocarpus litseifolius]|uniref:Uncharacterized protein n=1 Tax=Lithocarpus litseifolius TaxID=425828 RepID=A0AAW2C2S5_9ROSI